MFRTLTCRATLRTFPTTLTHSKNVSSLARPATTPPPDAVSTEPDSEKKLIHLWHTDAHRAMKMGLDLSAKQRSEAHRLVAQQNVAQYAKLLSGLDTEQRQEVVRLVGEPASVQEGGISDSQIEALCMRFFGFGVIGTFVAVALGVAVWSRNE